MDFPKEHAIPFTQEGNVMEDADMTTTVTNVAKYIQHQNVIETSPSELTHKPPQVIAKCKTQTKQPTKISVPTPIKIDKLLPWLKGYTRDEVNYIHYGLTAGFSINCTARPKVAHAHNLQSAFDHPHIIQEKIKKELTLGRIAGPFRHEPFPDFICSPIGLQPKKAEGQYRLIHHLSYPKGSSVNDGIGSEDTTVEYTSVDQAILVIKKLGYNCFMAKTDIKSAFRILPVHPSDLSFVGIQI